jgi:hypothetical protein
MFKNMRRRAVILVAKVWGMLDAECVLAEGQAVTAIGDTASTNIYQAANAQLGDMGQTGENIWIKAHCSTAATSAGAPTLQAVLQDSADGATFADVVAGPVTALAGLTVGALLLAVQPPPGMRQYFRVVWRLATATLTAGNFDAYVSNTIERNVARPSGFTVD